MAESMHSEIVKRLQSAVAASDFHLLEPVLAKHVRFGTCSGSPQVVQYLQQLAHTDQVGPVHLETRPDRVLATLLPGSIGSHPQRETGHIAVLFVQGGRIEELQFVASRGEALSATVTPPPPQWSVCGRR